MEREIVLDTETTGLDPKSGHRIIEIGCVELVNRLPTGKVFHKYVNQEREVPMEAYNIHGISSEFLKDKPLFRDVAQEFTDFIGDSRLVIHNAEFDVKFLNAELFYAKKPEINKDKVFCTLIHARKKFPGQQNSLDALCRRFNIDNSHRTKHGALLDSEILAEVYMELMGGKQNTIELKQKEKVKIIIEEEESVVAFNSRNFEVSTEEAEKHEALLKKMPNLMWNKINNQNN